LVSNGIEPGNIHIAMAGMKRIIADGEILRLTFEKIWEKEIMDLEI